MANPSDKHPAIRAFMNEIAGVDTEAHIQQNVCVLCGNPALSFRDPLSEQEFSISGMCQACQDKAFREE